ncbi:MAG TPA: hypothetical protein ENH19_02785, partial [Actinobacteria bacterium]|nr:hypothetical protein [Actinomycetes bacterium]HEX21561.1 hypothetical protein [Actinomycetota bacterium]
MELNNEIWRSLEDERAAHFLNPAVICGLGDFGQSIIGHLQEKLTSIPTLADSHLASYLVFNHKIQSVSEKMIQENKVDKTILTISSPIGSRLEFSAEIAKKNREIGKIFQSAAGKLLDLSDEKSSAEATKINFILVGDSQELAGSVGGIDLADLARRYLHGFIANLDLNVSGLFLLPKGLSEQGALVYAFLNDLGKFKCTSISGPILYDRCFLVSSTNTSGLLDGTATLDLFTEFLFLSLTKSKAEIERRFQMESGTIATFGLSSLVYPAEEVIERSAKSFAIKLIEDEILKKEDSFLEPAAARFISDNRMDIEGLNNRLNYFEDSTITAQIDFNPLYFSQVDMRHWPDRIASYNAFLETEKTGELLGKLEQNLAQTYNSSKAVIEQKVDELLINEPAVDRTRNFLLELKRKLKEMRNLAQRGQDELLKSLPSLKKRHKNLVKQIENLPDLKALISRLIVLGVLTFFLALRSMELMRRIPAKYFNVNFLPSDTVVGAAIIISTIFLGWLVYKRSEAKLFRAREKYLQAVEERHKYIIDWWIHQKTVLLLGDPTAPELMERQINSLSGLVEIEIQALEELRHTYLKVLLDFKEKNINFTSSKIRRPLMDAFNVSLNIKYKRGQFNRREEATTFLSEGGNKA